MTTDEYKVFSITVKQVEYFIILKKITVNETWKYEIHGVKSDKNSPSTKMSSFSMYHQKLAVATFDSFCQLVSKNLDSWNEYFVKEANFYSRYAENNHSTYLLMYRESVGNPYELRALKFKDDSEDIDCPLCCWHFDSEDEKSARWAVIEHCGYAEKYGTNTRYYKKPDNCVPAESDDEEEEPSSPFPDLIEA